MAASSAARSGWGTAVGRGGSGAGVAVGGAAGATTSGGRDGGGSGFGGPPPACGTGGSFAVGMSTSGRLPRTVSVTPGPTMSGAAAGFPIPRPVGGGLLRGGTGPRPPCSAGVPRAAGRSTSGVTGEGRSGPALGDGVGADGAGAGAGDGVTSTAGAGRGRYCQTAHPTVTLRTAAINSCTRPLRSALRNANTLLASCS